MRSNVLIFLVYNVTTRLLNSPIAHSRFLLTWTSTHGADKNKNERIENAYLRHKTNKSQLHATSLICAPFDQYYPQEIEEPKDQGRLFLR